MVRYDNKGKQQGWIAHAGLTLESKDSQALSTLVNELDGRIGHCSGQCLCFS